MTWCITRYNKITVQNYYIIYNINTSGECQCFVSPSTFLTIHWQSLDSFLDLCFFCFFSENGRQYKTTYRLVETFIIKIHIFYIKVYIITHWKTYLAAINYNAVNRTNFKIIRSCEIVRCNITFMPVFFLAFVWFLYSFPVTNEWCITTTITDK